MYILGVANDDVSYTEKKKQQPTEINLNKARAISWMANNDLL